MAEIVYMLCAATSAFCAAMLARWLASAANDRLVHLWNWQEQVGGMVVGEPVRRRLHGLEAFFRDTRYAPPPRWKMAVVTWMGVFPTVLLWSSLLPKVLSGLPSLAVVAIVNVFVVVTLAWGVMPLLTRMFAGWLHNRAS